MTKYFAVTTIVLMSLAQDSQATTCTGKWGGDAETSVQFLSGDRVKYCFKSDCWTQKVFKSGNDYLFLVGGDSAASVHMKSSGKGFNATWRLGNNSSKAKLRCQ